MDITTDPQRLDRELTYAFLSRESDWARDIPRATFERALRHSLCFAGWVDDRQVAFARVISDFATFANLVDVFVVPASRGRGHALELLTAVVAHPDLQGLRRFTLATRTAHGLYARFGFTAPRSPETWMECYRPDLYRP